MDVPESELTVSNIRMMDENTQKNLLFKAIRDCDLHIIRNILQANRNLLNAKMRGYEGSDVFEIIKNSKTKKCYSYTGSEKDGFFYPLHVAAESGHKNLVILLIKAGADVSLCDYKGLTAEEKCNGAAIHAFYELKGLKFESKERYQGKTDRQGNRHGQGVLFFKPEGYMETERQLYRGTFKNNLYNGHGTLYYVGTDVIAYIGRFRDGVRHGRGLEFDAQGVKVFQGIFKDDKREGRGEEYGEGGARVYKGEFSRGVRHGFGVAYFPENSRYYGRYENGFMSGVGIYVHPNGDRFEGMFFNNKPDGPGSFYQKDVYTGNWTGHHALWQAGRKIKELNIPFAPTIADLPDDSNKHMFTEIMNAQMDAVEGAGAAGEEEAVESGGVGSEGGGEAHGSNRHQKRLSFLYFESNEATNVTKSDWWKVQLGKYLKLPLKEGVYMGLPLPDNLLSHLHHKDDKGDEDGEEGEDLAEEEEEVEELSGYHFMECTTLFVSYVYITSASKVFEDRLANKGLVAEFPDFEAVYHLVIDAVDSYNELWEDAYKAQQMRIEEPPTPVKGSGKGPAPQSAPVSPNPAQANNPLLESRRKLFMSEKEKKEELILKQRAELAIKKGTAELDPRVEREIAQEVLSTLEGELTKLLVEEMEGSVHLNLPISRKNLHHVAEADTVSAAGKSGVGAGASASGGSVSGASAGSKPGGKEDGKKKDPKQGKPRSIVMDSEVPVTATSASVAVSIEDLFDITNLDATDFDNFHAKNASNDAGEGGKKAEDEDSKRSNEFAAELLYIMRTSMALS